MLDRRQRLAAVARVTSGNFLEMYDFMVFGYYAPSIAKAFFPNGDPVLSLLLSLATFGAGFLMRPLGAVVLGAYVDRHGRRAGLLLTLAVMAVGNLSIACTPRYETIGVAAPLIVLAGRLLQGLSAGVELGGVSVYLAEIAPPGRVGFYVAWQSASQQAAVIVAGVLGVVLSRSLGPGELARWGWRVPVLFGCAIVPVLFVMRRSLAETDAFLARARRPTGAEVLRSLVRSWRVVGTGVLFATTTTVFFYVITAYTPTFGSTVLELDTTGDLLVTVCVGLSNLFWLPVMGALSDRVGRRPLLVGAAALALATAYPVMCWLTSAPSFSRLLAAELWLSFLYASYNGAMVAHLTEIMPPEVRTVGFSLAYSLATALFGGFTPFMCTYLVFHTKNHAMPGAWLSLAAALGLTASVLEHVRRRATAQRARSSGAP